MKRFLKDGGSGLEQMSKQGWTLVVILAGFAVGVSLSRQPWQELSEQKRLRNTTLAETKQVEQQRSDLLRRNAELDSPYGMEEQARKAGYRKPYEQPLTLD
jgi:hypothetical protein